MLLEPKDSIVALVVPLLCLGLCCGQDTCGNLGSEECSCAGDRVWWDGACVRGQLGLFAAPCINNACKQCKRDCETSNFANIRL